MTSRELAIYKHGGPRALAAEADRQLAAKKAHDRRLSPRKAPGRAARATAMKAAKAARAEVRAACAERAVGRCEACNDWQGTYLEMDHFWGRARSESVESCWMLCNRCHHEKTDNHPSRATWLERFAHHARRNGYAEQSAKCTRALALEFAQHPSPAREEQSR